MVVLIQRVTQFVRSVVGARVEEFLYEKLDRKVPSRVTNGELLAQYMMEAASDFGATSPYGESWPAEASFLPTVRTNSARGCLSVGFLPGAKDLNQGSF